MFTNKSDSNSSLDSCLRPKTLITGATGLVGRQLMATEGHWEVRVAIRRPVYPAFDGVETTVVGDIDHVTDWGAALRGVDCVVHLAARVHVMDASEADDRQFIEVNALGTERLALMAAAAGVKRFVFLSSVKVNGEATHGRAYCSSDTAAPLDAYGKSKLLAEQKLFSVARAYAMDVVVIRPPLVYGPGVRANFLRLLSWTHKKIPLPLGSVQNARSLVSVWNLCDLIRAIVAVPSISSGVLMVSDGMDLSTPDLIRRLTRAMGKSPRLLPVPVSLLKLAGSMIGKSAEVSRLCGSLTVDISETKRQLGWTPPLSIDEGLARTAQWYMEEVVGRRG